MQFTSAPNFNNLEARNFVLEGLAAAPGSPTTGRFWLNTTSGFLEYYDGSQVVTLASKADITSLQNQITNIGVFQGGFDASGGSAPAGAGIEAGDYWRITVAGTISGIGGSSAVLSPGDLLVANVDTPSGASDYFAIQSNLDDSSLGGSGTTVLRQVIATNLVANTAIDLPAVTSPNINTIYSVLVYDSSNCPVLVKYDNSNGEIESEVAITGVTIIVTGQA